MKRAGVSVVLGLKPFQLAVDAQTGQELPGRSGKCAIEGSRISAGE